MNISNNLLIWYDTHKRTLPWRDVHDPYRTWISEIMLQQTRAESVMLYYERFLNAFPTVFDLAQAETDSVLKLWEGLGYYSRARNLHRCAKVIANEYRGLFPNSAEALRKLPGIGHYTANAIASIAFGEAVPALDGNQARVYTRLLCHDTPLKTPFDLEDFALSQMPVQRPGDYNQALMDLGASICTPKSPKCAQCPLREFCNAAREGCPEVYPIRIKTLKKREIDLTVVIAHHADGIVLHRRDEKGLLGGLYEFILLEGRLSPDEIRETLCDKGFENPVYLRDAGSSKHVFTHLIWHMYGAQVEVSAFPDGYFATHEPERYAFPSALKKYTNSLEL